LYVFNNFVHDSQFKYQKIIFKRYDIGFNILSTK
jgi:hypothetical protein